MNAEIIGTLHRHEEKEVTRNLNANNKIIILFNFVCFSLVIFFILFVLPYDGEITFIVLNIFNIKISCEIFICKYH